MLLYGSSGSGKSTFLRHLERILLRKFINQETKLIPVYCQLANINQPVNSLILETLKLNYGFEDKRIFQL